MSLEKLNNLLDWAKSNGSYINENLSFENVKDHGISCIINDSLTEEDISKGLIKIPQKLMLLPDQSIEFFQNEFPDVENKTYNKDIEMIFLLSKLKFDKKDETIVNGENLNKKFKPYIDYLPDNGIETGNPIFWNMEEKDLLDGTDAHIFMKRNFLKDLEDWKSIVSQLDIAKYPLLKDELLEYEAFKMGPNGGVAVNYLLNIKEISWTSFTAYLWSNCIIKSRAFPFVMFDKENNCAFLLPIVDLLNTDDEQKSRCKWETETIDDDDKYFVFKTLDPLEKLNKKCELYNNYGDKSNGEYLLNYGFCLKGNKFDSTTLSLKVDSSVIEGAKAYGVKIPKDSTLDSVNFVINKNSQLSKDLLNFFSYLVKLRSEKKGFTSRMKLEGLSQLKAIIKTKLKTIKQLDVTPSEKVTISHAKTIKIYRKSQKEIFQESLENIEKLEKKLILHVKPLSFKKAMANDKTFFNAFLLVFGTRTYNDLIEKGILDHAVLLWIMRIANKEVYPLEEQSNFPSFILKEFENVKKTVVIDNDDINEYLPLYETLFPSLCKKIPAVFDRGNWTLNHLIFAATVADRLTYKRETNGEVFFIGPKGV